MEISVPDPFIQSLIFAVPLFLAIFLTVRKDKNPNSLSIDHTNQLKGIAIMMVIFSHIGYFLDSGNKFLYPLSVAGGVGVNIFLFLSGYGLTLSSLKSSLSVFGFYYKRLSRVFVPMWIVLIFFLLLDYFLLNISYPLKTIVYLSIGFVPNADIYTTFNSPFWYFTLILFYYLIFPFVFWKRLPMASALVILILSMYILRLELPVVPDVLKLYKVHYLAFPIGIIFAGWQSSRFSFSDLLNKLHPVLKYGFAAVLIWMICYTGIHSGIGETLRKEQLISLITMGSFIILAMLIPFNSRFLILLGIYSYEIYLIQWPLLYRHDFLYKFMPAGIATILYFIVFIAMSFCIQRGVNLIFNPRNKSQH